MRFEPIGIVKSEPGEPEFMAKVESYLSVVYGSDLLRSFQSLKDSVSHLRHQRLGVMILLVPSEYERYETDIRVLSSSVPVLAICKGGDMRTFRWLMKRGVRGLIRSESFNELARAVKSVSFETPYMCQIMLKNLIGDFKRKVEYNLLSKRELQVLDLLSKGSTYHEISDCLFISFDTTKTHVNNIYRKLNARNKSEAVYKARIKQILI